ncbi:MAG: DUF1294 domain-containing protein [Gammaproteobacteria bacterium]|nr:DUF1294 domain-containing protein [Gammaproteobacteria bacterium]
MKYQYLPIYVMFVVMVCSYYLGYTPLLVLFVFISSSVLTYIAYSKDKSAAINGEWRVSENTLHLFSVLCGWPGAIIAQQKLRHKTKKTSFLIIFWIALFVNVGVFSWLHTQQGSSVLHSYTNKLEGELIGILGKSNADSNLLFFTKFRGHN